ncbi:MAG: type I 3-dehydroquinate dehydratase, partial [Planctomycetota bacterium]
MTSGGRSTGTAIVAVIAERTTARARAEVDRAVAHSDLVEWRLDALEEKPDFAAFMDGLGDPVILTCRRVEDGGGWEGAESDR